MDKKAIEQTKPRILIRPQKGPQEVFLSTPADIAVFGGAAGGGKTYALLLEAIRHVNNPGYGAVIFRRTSPQIKSEGGLWDTSSTLYPLMGASPKEHVTRWMFPSGAKVSFSHLQYDKDRHDWQGAQIPFIGFDELTHFSWRQWTYMLSRNRSTCGVRPYMRGTCNPDPDHWLRRFLSWWIDEDTGLPIKKRAGKLRWFTVMNDITEWADTPEELKTKFGPDVLPSSFTFIPSSVYDNKMLLDADPGYLAKLKALPLVDRERLLGGNWNIRESAGMFFRREWFPVVNAVPSKMQRIIRYWDLAATEENANDPSYTVGLKMALAPDGMVYILDIIRLRERPMAVEQAMKNLASQDGTGVEIGIFQDPGQAGKAQAQHLARMLHGYRVHITNVRESKGILARPLSAQVEAGNVALLAAPWNDTFIREAENFDGTDKGHADQIDAASGAYNQLTGTKGRVGAF